MGEKDWQAIFDREFSTPASPVATRVWREVFAHEYPSGLDPYSFVSRSELATFSELFSRAGIERLVDIGCGRGGPGLWVAAKTGAQLVGVDIAPSAARSAFTRADAVGLAKQAWFVVGSVDALPLANASTDAVMSVDALLFAPDKSRAIAEISRVIRRGGLLIFTSWDYRRQPRGRPPQVGDHRPLLEDAAFVLRRYEETDAWRERQERTTRGLLAVVDELAVESGEDPTELRADLEEMAATISDMTRRVLVVAERL